jgi:hypothetical protein
MRIKKGTVLPLSSWGNVERSSSTVVYDPYQGLPPVKVYGDRIDLEFGPLLQAVQLVMDRQSYDVIVRARLPGLDHLAHTLRTLHEETDLLELQSYLPALDQNLRRKIVGTTQERLSNFEAYRSPLRCTVAIWDALSPGFARALGQSSRSEFVQPIGVLHGARLSGDRLTYARISEVRRIIFKKRDLTADEEAIAKEVLRPYLDHVHTNWMLSSRRALGCPMHDWEDLGPIYEAVFAHSLEDECFARRRSRKLRELFVALPEYEPTNVAQFLKIMAHSRVGDLRGFITESTVTDRQFGPNLLKEATDEVAASGKRSKKVQHAVSAASMFGGALLHHAFSQEWGTSLAVGAAIGAATEIALEQTRRYTHDDIGWFLCLSSVKEA